MPGTVAVMGTPAEEGGGGKIIMLEKGAFKGVDASMMFHPSFRYDIGSPSLAAAMMTFRFHGRAAHGAVDPHRGINAADAAMLTFAGINAFRQHITSDARIHGVIKHTGDKANITPDYSEIDMVVRAATREYMEELVERVLDCARGASLMTRATFEVERGMTYYDSRQCDSYDYLARENFAKLGIKAEQPGGDVPKASGDGGNVSHAIPHLGITAAISDHVINGHSVEWRDASISPRGHQAMMESAKVLAMTMCDLLYRPDVLERIRAEHKVVTARK